MEWLLPETKALFEKQWQRQQAIADGKMSKISNDIVLYFYGSEYNRKDLNIGFDERVINVLRDGTDHLCRSPNHILFCKLL